MTVVDPGWTGDDCTCEERERVQVTGAQGVRTVFREQAVSENHVTILQCAIMKNNQAAVILYAGIALFLIYNLHSYGAPRGEVTAGKWVSLLNGRGF